jgi:hypothetical protein
VRFLLQLDADDERVVIRALRTILKIALRRYGLRAVRVEQVRSDGAT